ncbi:hypothetical protein Hanom_Chr08g00720211 [Helianthus anomalus]
MDRHGNNPDHLVDLPASTSVENQKLAMVFEEEHGELNVAEFCVNQGGGPVNNGSDPLVTDPVLGQRHHSVLGGALGPKSVEPTQEMEVSQDKEVYFFSSANQVRRPNKRSHKIRPKSRAQIQGGHFSPNSEERPKKRARDEGK